MKKPQNPAKRGVGPGETPAQPDATRTPIHVEQLERLAHELNNLLDGSIRNVGLARRAIEDRGPGGAGEGLDDIKRRLDTATFALERMADLVHASMQGGSQPLGSPLLNQAPPITIGEAASHAVEVVRPEAQEHRVALAVEIDEAAFGIPAGPLYPVLLNGVRNALEAIGRSGGIGRVVVQVRRGQAPDPAKDARRWVEIDIIDDGEGPPQGRPADAVFEAGFTTKETGGGLGLAVSRDLVKQAGGTIELRRRPDRHDSRRPGAVLRIRYPESKAGMDQVVGGPGPRS
ncbi:MAG: HAMP domain-containing histidine kinase [Phycisphaerales bacterium]|nr:HAMP domain-containing histidine kinase [Phycisphaerales bacterium]